MSRKGIQTPELMMSAMEPVYLAGTSPDSEKELRQAASAASVAETRTATEPLETLGQKFAVLVTAGEKCIDNKAVGRIVGYSYLTIRVPAGGSQRPFT